MECPICFETAWITTTPCQHPICIDCLCKLKKDECPSCRRAIFDQLPKCMKSIVAMNTRPDSGQLNIYSEDQFPSLG